MPSFQSLAWCGCRPAVQDSISGRVRASSNASWLLCAQLPVSTICRTPGGGGAGEDGIAVVRKALMRQIGANINHEDAGVEGRGVGLVRQAAMVPGGTPLHAALATWWRRGIDDIDHIEAHQALACDGPQHCSCGTGSGRRPGTAPRSSAQAAATRSCASAHCGGRWGRSGRCQVSACCGRRRSMVSPFSSVAGKTIQPSRREGSGGEHVPALVETQGLDHRRQRGHPCA